MATLAIFLAAYGFGGQSYVDGQSFVQLGERQFDSSFESYADSEFGAGLVLAPSMRLAG